MEWNPYQGFCLMRLTKKAAKVAAICYGFGAGARTVICEA
jgi:hypothetical protein